MKFLLALALLLAVTSASRKRLRFDSDSDDDDGKRLGRAPKKSKSDEDGRDEDKENDGERVSPMMRPNTLNKTVSVRRALVFGDVSKPNNNTTTTTTASTRRQLFFHDTTNTQEGDGQPVGTQEEPKKEPVAKKCSVEPMSVLGNYGTTTTTTTSTTTSSSAMTVCIPYADTDGMEICQSDNESNGDSRSTSPMTLFNTTTATTSSNKDHLSFIPHDLLNVIIDHDPTMFLTVARLSRFFYDFTRVRYRDLLYKTLSNAGLHSVCNKFLERFDGHCELRDEIIGYMIKMAKNIQSDAKKAIKGKCDSSLDLGMHGAVDLSSLVKLYWHSDRPIAEKYELLFGEGVWGVRLTEQDVSMLQQMVVLDLTILQDLIASSINHPKQLERFLSLRTWGLKESKLAIMLKCMFGQVTMDWEVVKVLADSIHQNLWSVVCKFNGGSSSIADIKAIHDQLLEADCEQVAVKISMLVRTDKKLSSANTFASRLGQTHFWNYCSPVDFMLLFDEAFCETHKFTDDQCVALLKGCQVEALLMQIAQGAKMVTARLQKLLGAAVGLEEFNSLFVESQFHMHIIMITLEKFGGWEFLNAHSISLISIGRSDWSKFLTADQVRFILKHTCPDLLSVENVDERVEMVYASFSAQDRRAISRHLSTHQIKHLFTVFINKGMVDDIQVLFDCKPKQVVRLLLKHINKHPDYVPHQQLLPILFLLTTNDTFRDNHKRAVNSAALAAARNGHRDLISDARWESSTAIIDSLRREEQAAAAANAAANAADDNDAEEEDADNADVEELMD